MFIVFSADECQLFIDVDCSQYSYVSTPSPVIVEKVDTVLEQLGDRDTETNLYSIKTAESSVITASPSVSLANSLLSALASVTKEELREAFCRDIDTFSWELNDPVRHYETFDDATGLPQWQVAIIVFLIAALVLGFVFRNKFLSFVNKCRGNDEVPTTEAQ